MFDRTYAYKLLITPPDLKSRDIWAYWSTFHGAMSLDQLYNLITRGNQKVYICVGVVVTQVSWSCDINELLLVCCSKVMNKLLIQLH